MFIAPARCADMNFALHACSKINSGPYNCFYLMYVNRNEIQEMKMIQLFKKRSAVVVQRPMPSLVACLLFDFIGYASYAVPFFGEFLDLLWAPVSAIIFWKMFGFRKGFFGGVFSFAEELMPGLDFIPTFTINWVLLYFKRNKEALSLRTLIR